MTENPKYLSPEEEQAEFERKKQAMDVLAHTSLTGILLKFAADFSSPKPKNTDQNSYYLQKIEDTNASSEKESALTNEINESELNIIKDEQNPHLSVAMPDNLKQEINYSVDFFGRKLMATDPNIPREVFNLNLMRKKLDLQKKIILNMISEMYLKNPSLAQKALKASMLTFENKFKII